MQNCYEKCKWWASASEYILVYPYLYIQTSKIKFCDITITGTSALTVTIPVHYTLDHEILCSICTGQVVNLTRDPQFLVSKQDCYSFCRPRSGETFSAPCPVGSRTHDLRHRSQMFWLVCNCFFYILLHMV